jgi:hypothetical protein
MTQLDKADQINKFLQIESWAYRGRHLVESQSTVSDRLKECIKRIRHDLEDLEVMLGVDD